MKVGHTSKIKRQLEIHGCVAGCRLISRVSSISHYWRGHLHKYRVHTQRALLSCWCGGGSRNYLYVITSVLSPACHVVMSTLFLPFNPQMLYRNLGNVDRLKFDWKYLFGVPWTKKQVEQKISVHFLYIRKSWTNQVLEFNTLDPFWNTFENQSLFWQNVPK